MLSILLVAAAVLLLLLGLVGCVLPVLPGPPLSFAAILLLWGAGGWEAATFGTAGVILMGAAAAGVTVFDAVAPVIGARRYGASRAGVWGSVLGLIAGTILFPPLGTLAGAFAGALAGEAAAGKSGGEAMRAAWGVFVGTVAGILLKLAVSGVITYTFLRELLGGGGAG